MEAELTRQLWSRSTWQVVLESILSCVIIFSAFFGNLLVCIAVLRYRHLRATKNFFLISLALSDVLMGALGMPLSLAVFITGRWPFADFVCQAQGTICFILAAVSQLNVSMIAINRYIKMTKSASLYRRLYTSRSIIIMIITSWIFSAVLVMPYFLIGNLFVFHPGKAMCIFDLNNTPLAYTALISCVLVPIPFCIILFCYYKVLKVVRSHSKRVTTSNASSHISAPFLEEMKMTKVLLAIVVAFSICWIPLSIIDITNLFRGDFSLPRGVYLWYTNAAAASSSCNPAIYARMNREFRKAFKQLLGCKRTALGDDGSSSHSARTLRNNDLSVVPT